MGDGVKFIFKTLFKVPIIILVAYGILNLFAFCFTYFKLLGVSYVVMQTAVENNYLPATEFNSIYNYVNTFNNIEMIRNADIVVGTNSTGGAVVSGGSPVPALGAGDARAKRQYGGTVTVGVTCDYVFIFPLRFDKVEGLGGGTATVSGASTFSMEETENNMVITYTVPGLRYYPDLEVT